jgi:hypothetical protein
VRMRGEEKSGEKKLREVKREKEMRCDCFL